MSNKKTLTKKEKQDLEAAVQTCTISVDPLHLDYRAYTLVGSEYTVEAYNNGRRVVKKNDKIIADTSTFGNTVNDKEQVAFLQNIVSIIVSNYITQLNNAVYGRFARAM